MKKIPLIIRTILTLLLLCGVYTETGKWTTISLFLIFLAIEIYGYLIEKMRVKLMIKEIFKGVFKE